MPRQLVDVATGAGVFTARREGDLVRATGIRYARAERFRAPVAEPVHDEPVDATHLSPPARRTPPRCWTTCWSTRSATSPWTRTACGCP